MHLAGRRKVSTFRGGHLLKTKGVHHYDNIVLVGSISLLKPVSTLAKKESRSEVVDSFGSKPYRFSMIGNRTSHSRILIAG